VKPGTPSRLPPPSATTLVGRDRELAAADAALLRPPTAGHRICAVTGAPGVGKTAFALAWPTVSRTAFPTAGSTPTSGGEEKTGVPPVQILRGLLDALGAAKPNRVASPDEVAAAFHRAVRGRRMLFVLDAVGSQQVRDVLPGEPQCPVVATSRHCLTGLIAHEGAAPIPLVDLSDGG
jgi:hypothetical protein